jgi:hypothetical protein
VGVRPLGVAYLHLVLLGAFTPAMLHVALGVRGRPMATAAFAAGLAKMLAALLAMGWAPAASVATGLGVNATGLLHAALTAAVIVTPAAVLLLRPGGRVAEPAAPIPR